MGKKHEVFKPVYNNERQLSYCILTAHPNVRAGDLLLLTPPLGMLEADGNPEFLGVETDPDEWGYIPPTIELGEVGAIDVYRVVELGKIQGYKADEAYRERYPYKDGYRQAKLEGFHTEDEDEQWWWSQALLAMMCYFDGGYTEEELKGFLQTLDEEGIPEPNAGIPRP